MVLWGCGTQLTLANLLEPGTLRPNNQSEKQCPRRCVLQPPRSASCSLSHRIAVD